MAGKLRKHADLIDKDNPWYCKISPDIHFNNCNIDEEAVTNI